MQCAPSGRMLLVSDDEARHLIDEAFRDCSYNLSYAHGGEDGLRLAAVEQPGVILADLPLEDMPAIEFITRIREWSTVPILALSRSRKIGDTEALLEAGADDCLLKPYGLIELRARVEVAFRHRRMQRPEFGPILRMGSTVIDLANQSVVKNGQPIHLARIEFKILAELVRNAGRVVTQKHLLHRIWPNANRSDLPVLRAYISTIRKKVSSYPDGDIVIETIPGVGYRLFHTWSGM